MTATINSNVFTNIIKFIKIRLPMSSLEIIDLMIVRITCPAIILAVIRKPNVIGRMRILIVSIITRIKISIVGLDFGTRCVKTLLLFFMKFKMIEKKKIKEIEKLMVGEEVIEKL